MADVENVSLENEEEKKPGIYHRVTHHLCYHVIQSLLSYMALITMIAAIIVLEYPPHFNPKVKQRR